MQSPPSKRRLKVTNGLILLFVVVIPFACVTFYMLFVAQPRYVSESIVVVKQVSESSASNVSGLGVLLGANSTSVEDARYLKAYIESPDMLNRLGESLDVRAALEGDGKDPLFQLSEESPKERFLKQYQRYLSVTLNEQNQLLTVKTEGFTPEFTHSLNQAILSEGERFINEISQRVAREQLLFSEKQLQEASQKLAKSKESLIAYQNDNQMLDPLSNAESVNGIISGFNAQIAELRAQERALLSYLNPETPQVISIRSQITALQQQIDSEQAKLTSRTGTKLNRQALQFESLKSDVEFSTDLYRLALTASEKGRLEAAQKLKNLVVISSPQMPQQASYPRTAYVLLSALLLLLMLYGIVRLTLSVIRDHKD